MATEKIFGIFDAPEWTGYILVAFPILYIFMGMKWNILIPILVGVLGIFIINDRYIGKSKVKSAKDVNLGPSQPFLSQDQEEYIWVDDGQGNRFPKKVIKPGR